MSADPKSLDAAYERRAMEQGLVKNPVFSENKDYKDHNVQKQAENPTPDYYNKQYRGIKLDPYRIIDIYKITNGAQQHALKKLLRAGQSIKDTLQDIKEIEDSCRRWREMLLEDGVPAQEQKAERALHGVDAEPTKISVSSIEGAPSLGHRMHPGIREALNQLIVRAYTSESEQSLPSRRDRLERLLTYQGLTISQIIAALSREGYSSEGVIKELEWLVTHGVAYYNPTGAVWCRAKL